jgi:hypothetical protein
MIYLDLISDVFFSLDENVNTSINQKYEDIEKNIYSNWYSYSRFRRIFSFSNQLTFVKIHKQTLCHGCISMFRSEIIDYSLFSSLSPSLSHSLLVEEKKVSTRRLKFFCLTHRKSNRREKTKKKFEKRRRRRRRKKECLTSNIALLWPITITHFFFATCVCLYMNIFYIQ